MRKALFILLLFSLSSFAQAQEELSPPESTVKKQETLSELLTEIEELDEILSELGKPAVKDAGESNDAYLKRVERIFKGRAYQLHLYGKHLERVLLAYYGMESDLNAYRDWADQMAKELEMRPEQYKKKVVELQQEVEKLKPQVTVLASLIHQDATAAKDAELAEEMANYYTEAELKSLPGYKELAAGYGKLTADERRTEWDKITGRLVDHSYEIDLLEISVIPETVGLAILLPDAHHEAIRNADKFYRDNKKKLVALQDRASQLSIMAKYVSDNLSLVPPGPIDPEKRRQLAKLIQEEPQFQSQLEKFLGSGQSSRSQILKLLGKASPGEYLNPELPGAE